MSPLPTTWFGNHYTFEEFNESLIALKEEQEGGFSQDLFDFSDSSSSEDAEDDTSTKKSEGYKPVPTSEPSPTGKPAPSDGGKPSEGAPSVGRSSRGVRPPLAPTLSSTDSFILKQLRGWRLLSGACLTAEEWHAVLASTNNKLDYQNVSMALTILYDDQIQSHRGAHHSQLSHGGPQLFSLEDNDWPWESSWWSDWDWANYSGWPEDEEEWQMEEEQEEPETTEESKKENEAMAQQTWSQAHRTTQMVKKDLARECPDRFAPRGKGGRLHYMGSYEDENLYAFQKGKGKNHGKGGKNAYAMEELYYMKGKFGGKSKSKSKSKGKPNVNAYAMEYDDYGYGYYVLDFSDENLDLHAAAREPDPAVANRTLTTTSKGKTSPALGMLDTGATCSAGPESSIKNMVNALLQQDKQAKITVDGKMCPRFRYGSGSWGRALYRLTMESSLTGHRFQAFALPDPAESQEPWFSEGMLVPVLIGMDFIDSHGMIIDFSDGTCKSSPRKTIFIATKLQETFDGGHCGLFDFWTNM